MGEKIRAFIAICLPESTLHAIAKVQDQLRKSGFSIRWVRKEGMHLTLKFLGDIDKGNIEGIRSAMEESAKGILGFALQAKGLGVFPHMNRPRVVWIGLSGDVGVLSALHGQLESHLEAQGFPKEKRRFTGHLTLGRAKGGLDNDKLRKALEKLDAFETALFPVQSVILYQSMLRPQGAVYTKLAEVHLKSD
jgi:2'-5' RNA ligase